MNVQTLNDAGWIYYKHKYVVIGRCGSPIRRVVSTCHSEGVRLQSWVTRHSYIVARSTKRTRTLIFFGGIHQRYRTEYFLIETPLLQPLFPPPPAVALYCLFFKSIHFERCFMTRRDAAESFIWTQMIEFIWTQFRKVSEIKQFLLPNFL